MERLSQRDNVLLGYIPRKSFGLPSSGSLDVDFHDVFGGPPRRSTIQDWRSSNSGDEEAVVPRDPWSGLSEKPVFGVESSRGSRKYPSDDFFGDIFGGDECSSPTTRKLSRDPFSSSPASRVSSPSRSLPAQSESLRGSSLSLLPVLSLPGKLAKEMDSSAFPAQNRNPRKNKETALIGLPSSPGASTSRFSIQVIQGQEGLKKDLQPSYRQSSLSKEVSLNSEGSGQSEESGQASKYVKHDTEDSSTSKGTYNSTQFHFSIYKWPSTGLPVVMPLRVGNSSSKESSEAENIGKEHGGSNLLGHEVPSGNNNMLAEIESKKNQDNDIVISTKTELMDSSEMAEEALSAKPEPKPLSNLQNIFKRVQDNLLSQNAGKDKTGSGASVVDTGSIGGFREKRKSVFKKEVIKSEEPLYCLLKENKPGSGACVVDNHSTGGTEKKTPLSENELSNSEEPLYCLLKDMKNDSSASGPDKDSLGDTAKMMPLSKKEAPKREEPLYCLLKDDSKTQGNGKAVDKASAKKGSVKSIPTSAGDVGNDKKVKKQTGKRNILKFSEASTSTLPHALTNVDEKPVNNKVKGKVKDVVKIFNQEAPPKSTRNVETQDQGHTVKGAGRAEDQATVFATKADQENRTLSDTPSRVDRSTKHFFKPIREIKTAAQIPDYIFERKNSSASCSGKIEITVDNIEESCEDLDCTVKELPQDQNNQPQAGQNNEEIQASDARIRKWSNGKEGNIRSLLSTLQYVLWPESGWKPVPLVDIIEGSSVRRSYQKALLCLHPDKLQQKGAAPHQKYIAEKVFDILQEAWTHFNSLGSF